MKPVTLKSPASRRRQRGLSLFGLLFWAIVIGFIGYLAVVVLPTLNEYFTIQRTIEKVAAENPPTVAAVRSAFDRQKDIGSFQGNDDVVKIELFQNRNMIEGTFDHSVCRRVAVFLQNSFFQ